MALGFVGVFAFSFLINLIPFVGPSNLIIAGALASLFSLLNPLVIGFLVALGASTAKMIHYGASLFVGSSLKSKRSVEVTDGRKRRLSRFGVVLAFLAAVSPIPDDPIVVSLALLRYSPLKFFASFFIGKIIVTVAGAYLGQAGGLILQGYLGEVGTIVVSVALTIAITIVLIRREYFQKRLLETRVGRRLMAWIDSL